MSIIIVHLSDSHFSMEGENLASTRSQSIQCAIRSVMDWGDYCAIIFSGDVAYSGRPEDYGIAANYLVDLEKVIHTHTGKKPCLLLVPGNHDHNFTSPNYDESIRDMIIDNTSPSKPPSPGMNEKLMATLKCFGDFIDNLSSSTEVYAPSNLLESMTVKFDLISIKFYLLNTTRFTKKHDSPGISWFPIEHLSEEFKRDANNGNLNIAVLHHPYDWYRRDNAKDFKRLLESRCDIVFTGHEHNPDIIKQTRRTIEQNLYVEGGILQDPDDSENSSFNMIKLRPENQTFLCTTFKWNGKSYEQITEFYEHRYLRLRQPLMNELEIRNEWNSWLEEIGTDFRHPREQNLKMSDVFIYPDLQKLDIRKACSPMGIVRDRDLVGYIQEKKRIFISGSEKIGKTSLSKQLFKDLREAGFATLLIRSDFSVPRQDKKTFDFDRIHNAIDHVVKKIYSGNSAVAFWQSAIKDRAIIIDDYDRLTLGDGGRDKLIRWFDNNFGLVIVISSPGIRMTEILHKTEVETILWTFDHADITECDAESRFALIGKWLLTGTDAYQIDTAQLYQEKLRYGAIIDNIIDKGAIPSLPIFILMMMQQLEAGTPVEGSTGVYGTLYELIIRDVIYGVARTPAELEVMLNYLSEFAFAIHSSGKRAINDIKCERWHEDYCDNYNCKLHFEKVVKDFINIGVFNRCGTDIGFKYRYYYCFFLARYLSNNIHDQEIMRIIEYLCSSLHNIDVANTILFLCHQSKDPRIFNLIMSTIRGHFSNAKEYNLIDSPAILPKETIKPARLILPSETPENELINEMRLRDESERPHSLSEITSAERDLKEEDDEAISLINAANSAHHAIRICGQLLRNFYGNMKGIKQIEVIRECYGLCLRLMCELYEHLEKDKDMIAQSLAEIIQHRYPKKEYEELDKNVRQSLNAIALRIAYGLIKHTSKALGLAVLKPSYDKYLLTDSITVSHRILDLSTRLECYFNDFPEGDVKTIAKELEGKFIGREVLRVIVWEHFKLFRRDIQLRQRVCSHLDIEASQTPLITAPKKEPDYRQLKS